MTYESIETGKGLISIEGASQSDLENLAKMYGKPPGSLPEGAFLVAKAKADVIGAILVKPFENAGRADWLYSSLCVKEEYKNQGVDYGLLAGADNLVLDFLAENNLRTSTVFYKLPEDPDLFLFLRDIGYKINKEYDMLEKRLDLLA